MGIRDFYNQDEYIEETESVPDNVSIGKDPLSVSTQIVSGWSQNPYNTTPGGTTYDSEPAFSPVIGPVTYVDIEVVEETIVTDYDSTTLQILAEDGAIFYAIMKDGTEVEVDWTEIQPIPETIREETINLVEDIINAPEQFFWNDQQGVHVAEEDRASWESSVEDNFSDYNAITKPHHNMLMNSQGFLFRKALNNLSVMTSSSVAFYDGQGNTSEHIRALFGSQMAQIGKSGSDHVIIDTQGVTAYKADGSLHEIVGIIDGAHLKNSTITSSKIASSTIENSNIKDGTITGAKIQGSTLTNIPYAEIDQLKTRNVTADAIQAATGFVASLATNSITVAKLVADQGIIDNLETNFAHIQNGVIDNANINVANVNGLSANYAHITNGVIDNAKIGHADVNGLSANYAHIVGGVIDNAKIGHADVDGLSTNYAHIENGVIDNAHINVANVDDISANYAHIQNGVIDNAKIGHADVNGLSANYAHIANGVIDNAKIGYADVNGLSANYASIVNLNAASGRIDDLEADHVSTSDLAAETARIDTLVANTADLAIIRANSAKVTNLTAAELEADHAIVGSLDTNYAQIDMANVNNAWIQNGTIKDAAISDGMINSVSANKLTAGTIDASNITVTNLNADNITTGTINGQRIGQGSLSLDKLSEDVYTETEVDSIVSNLQTQIDGAIETWTGTVIPTLQNAPASSWTTNSVKDTHVGDVYFIVNSQSNQNGYNYRFTKSGTGNNVTYSWQLIKDSDVTNALARLTTAEGKITTFDSDISQLKTDTGTLTTKTTSLETRMSNAEADILDKVDTTTFNEVSDTVDSHSQSITQMTTTLSNKADSSAVSSLTTRVSKNEQDISGINSTIGSLETTVESKADGSTVETISSKVNTISDTVDGHTQNISSIVSTQTHINHELDKTIVETVRLYTIRSSSDIPPLPTTPISSGTDLSDIYLDNTGNELLDSDNNPIGSEVWSITKPSYNSSKPNYFYCYQHKHVDGSYTWSNVVKDNATTESQNLGHVTSENLTIVTTKVNNISDTVDGHTQSISSITSTQTTMQGRLDKTIVETTQLWFSKSDTTAPSKPTAQVTSTSTDGNAWRIVVPEYNASYPNYYYCYQWKYSDGTYGWSSVTHDIATGESQERARTAITNAAAADTKAGNALSTAATAKSTADTANGNASTAISTANTAKGTADTAKATADKNIKESQQLWFTKADNSAPAKPTAKVTSTVVTGNTWTTKVPTYNASYPNYFYCIQYVAADDTVTWSDVVYDQATTEVQTLSRTASANLSTLQQDYATFKQTTQQFESAVGSTYATKTELTQAVEQTTLLESRVSANETAIDQNKEEISLRAKSSDVYTKSQTDSLMTTEVTNRNSAINQKADAITASVANTYTNKTEFNSAKSEIKATTDGITSEVSKISSAKYVTSATSNWSLTNIKTWATEGYTGIWPIISSANLRVGDTVYIKGTDSTRNCMIYIKVTVTDVTSNASITGISHGYEDILPVETIKSTINQSSDSVKIQANHIDIEGAAIFSSGRLSSEALNDTYDKKGTAEKVVSDFDKQIIDKLDNSIIETIQLWMISSTQSIPTKPLTPVFTNAELSDAYLDSSGNTILDSSGNTINSITWTTIKPSYDLTKPYYYYCYQYKHYDGSYTWSDVYKDNALSSTASESVSEEQYVYISKASGTNSVASNTTWVTVNSDSQNTWTTKRPTYNSSYPVLFIAKQRKTVSGVVTCTIPVKDDTTTIIDGGHITTGIIDASKVTVTNLDASKITTGSLLSDRIKANVIDAVNNGTGTINADKINVSNLTIGYNQLTDTPTIPTKVSQLSNDSDFVNADQLSTVIDGQNSVNDRVDESIVNTKILYTTRDVSTLPDAPNTPIVSDSNTSGAYLDSSSNSLLDSSGNAIMSKTWTVSRPSYSQEEPYYFYCYQYEHADGSYTWSNVMRDDAINESFKILSSRVAIVCSSIDYNNSTASLQAKLYVNNVETSGNQYQWFRDGSVLVNQTNQILLVTSSMGINHLYSCTVDY